jgi:hypothetical protein
MKSPLERARGGRLSAAPGSYSSAVTATTNGVAPVSVDTRSIDATFLSECGFFQVREKS